MPRLFVAIPLPAELGKMLLAAFPHRQHHGIRFTPEANLHITAHFLGNIEAESVPAISARLHALAASVSAFELKFAGLEVVSRDKKPAMVWARFEENAAFEELSLELRRLFPTEEKRKPNPHVTLARIRQLKKLPFELPDVKPFSFIAERLELLESTLNNDGAQYTLCSSHKLM